MASLEYLREEMNAARERADNKALPAHIRHASESMFWHCYRRVGTMERSGAVEDEPGHYMVQHSELAHVQRSLKQADATPTIGSEQARREYLDRKAEVEIEARERL
jgi:hypothetical protein